MIKFTYKTSADPTPRTDEIHPDYPGDVCQRWFDVNMSAAWDYESLQDETKVHAVLLFFNRTNKGDINTNRVLVEMLP